MNHLKAHFSSKVPPVHFKKLQSIRQIILDRPKQLNALNLDMVRLITPQLQAWQESELCKVIVITNLPKTKAFCAGGDVKSISLAMKSGNPEELQKSLEFFQEEYKLNHLISTAKKPYIAIMNGITMGGGVGLSVHGHFRIVTENTMIAMPEVNFD
jgi:3-hydroxyisobutyryl-CoA hydrolase